MHSVAQAANILDTSEYEVLCRAYADWHGAPANPMIMQHAFSQYFRQGEPPYWARHYTRKVIQDFEQRHTQQAGALHSFLLMWLEPISKYLPPPGAVGSRRRKGRGESKNVLF